MARFKRRPHEIEVGQWFPNQVVKGVCYEVHKHQNVVGSAHVHTRYGKLVYLTNGQYVVPDGQFFYPCDASVFEPIYEPSDTEVYEVEQPQIEQAPIGGMRFKSDEDGDEELRGIATNWDQEIAEAVAQYVSRG